MSSAIEPVKIHMCMYTQWVQELCVVYLPLGGLSLVLCSW